MRTLILLTTLALFGCNDASVIGADGKFVGACSLAEGVKCIGEKCPDGLDVISSTIVKCKAKPPCAEGK